MGVEQNASSNRLTADLLPDSELTDIRLHRAYRAWSNFRQKHPEELSDLGNLRIKDVVFLASELGESVYQAVVADISGGSHGNWISEEKLTQLDEVVSGDGSRIMFVRHGEQSPPEWIFSIPRPELRKIRMMQNPFNREDFITNKGIAEAFSTALTLAYVQEKNGKKTTILTSENSRAWEVANIIAVVVRGSTVSVDEGLSCITYKDERDDPTVDIEQLLEDLPSGMMPWNPELVDKWCKTTRSGIMPSEAIINSVGRIYNEGLNRDDDSFYVVLTHNQQLAEFMKLAGRLKDSAVRFPELSMLVASNDKFVVFRRGVLTEGSVNARHKDMRKILENFGEGFEWYKIRREEYDTNEKIPFLVSPEPFCLTEGEAGEVEMIGKDVVAFMEVVSELYWQENEVKELLDRSKPDFFKLPRKPNYLFVRPDLIITDQGFSICEIEMSPFGLALAELLNRAYISAGFDSIVDGETLKRFIAGSTPSEGTIVYSQNTSSYAGQLQFLASKVFSGEGRDWRAEHIDAALGKNHPNIYRAFYLYEYMTDLFINNITDVFADSEVDKILPSLTPYMEEKALLALIWDRRWESFFKKRLGIGVFDHLRRVVPPTWIVGQEQFFTPALPDGMESSVDLASLSKAKRNFVLKKSGFGHGSSWAEGVNLLQEKSGTKAREILAAAQKDALSLFVIQEFRPSKERRMVYADKATHQLVEMRARIRLTPYFSMTGESKGRLIAIKATGCENTNYIHASTSSINTAVCV